MNDKIISVGDLPKKTRKSIMEVGFSEQNAKWILDVWNATQCYDCDQELQDLANIIWRTWKRHEPESYRTDWKELQTLKGEVGTKTLTQSLSERVLELEEEVEDKNAQIVKKDASIEYLTYENKTLREKNDELEDQLAKQSILQRGNV